MYGLSWETVSHLLCVSLCLTENKQERCIPGVWGVVNGFEINICYCQFVLIFIKMSLPDSQFEYKMKKTYFTVALMK